MSAGQHFERFEVKYLAPLAYVERVMSMIKGHMVEDAVAKKTGASQVNTSLYFDSPHFTFFEQHVSGSPDRIKLRVRYYGDSPTGPCFFEVKRRQKMVVMKQRAVLPLEQTRAFIADLSRTPPVKNDTLSLFQYLALRCQAEPKLLVRARRLAMRSVDPSLDVRLTVDSDVAWQPTRFPDVLTPRANRWRNIAEAQRGLIEVKFLDVKPWWLGQVTQLLAPFRVSFSKYIAAAYEARHDPFFTVDAA